jgi:hypothetical protein
MLVARASRLSETADSSYQTGHSTPFDVSDLPPMFTFFFGFAWTLCAGIPAENYADLFEEEGFRFERADQRRDPIGTTRIGRVSLRSSSSAFAVSLLLPCEFESGFITREKSKCWSTKCTGGTAQCTNCQAFRRNLHGLKVANGTESLGSSQHSLRKMKAYVSASQSSSQSDGDSDGESDADAMEDEPAASSQQCPASTSYAH